MSTLSSVLHTPPFPIVAPFSLIPLCPPHRLLSLHLLLYRFTSSSLRHSDCLRHSVLPSPIVSAEVQCGCCLPKPASFLSRPHPFTPLQPICPESLFTTSSFLSLSPLIYLSRWAPTRSDALPLCLCRVCVICIPLPATVKLIGLSEASVAPPKPFTLLAVTGARPSRITLQRGRASSLRVSSQLMCLLLSWPHTSCIYFPPSLYSLI